MFKLLQFSVGNFRSFLKRRTFTFAPTSIKDEPKASVSSSGKDRFSKVSAVYGANSSGKSNLVTAISEMLAFIDNSVRLNDEDTLAFDPFRLSQYSPSQPSYFEIVFLNGDGRKIRYGFENSATKIEKEWLFVRNASGKEDPCFLRDEEGIAVNEEVFPEGIDREEMTNDNRLFLSLVAQLGGPVSKNVLNSIRSGIVVLSGIDNRRYASRTKQSLNNPENVERNKEILDFFHKLELGFNDIEVQKGKSRTLFLPTNSLPRAIIENLETFSHHNVYDEDGNVVGDCKFKFTTSESKGTQKIFELAAPIFDTLHTGGTLVVDELDAKMHPLISQQIVSLFSSEVTNPLNAQLIFTTHDTNLLSSRLLRRDQIWFTEKDNVEATDLYRLSDIVLPDGSKPRGDGNLELNYIKGRYGAIPFLNGTPDWDSF